MAVVNEIHALVRRSHTLAGVRFLQGNKLRIQLLSIETVLFLEARSRGRVITTGHYGQRRCSIGRGEQSQGSEENNGSKYTRSHDVNVELCVEMDDMQCDERT